MELDRLGLAGDDEQDDSDNSNRNSNRNNNRNNKNVSWVRGAWVPPSADKKVRMQAIPENLYHYMPPHLS